MKSAWQNLVEESKVQFHLSETAATTAGERFFEIAKTFSCMRPPNIIDSETRRELSLDSWKMIVCAQLPVWLCQHVWSQHEEECVVSDRMRPCLSAFLSNQAMLFGILAHKIVVRLSRTIKEGYTQHN